MSRHLPLRIAAIAFVLAGSIACNDSTSSPMLTPTPTPATPPPPVVPPGFTVSSMSPTAGPTIGGDYIRVTGTGFRAGVTVTVDGVAVRVDRVTDTIIDARTVAHATGAVDVVITNPDGQTTTVPGGYTFGTFSLTGGPDLVAPGGELTVSWVTPPGRGCRGGGDWIALYRIGDPDNTGAANGHSDIWYDHVCGVVSGTWKLKAPAQPGEYEFRFLTGDFSVARSGLITVRE